MKEIISYDTVKTLADTFLEEKGGIQELKTDPSLQIEINRMIGVKLLPYMPKSNKHHEYDEANRILRLNINRYFKELREEY